MPPPPNRKALEAMKRVDVQKLCKDYGVKANLKTEALIDLLLEASQPPPPKPAPAPPQRSVSTRTSSRAGTRSRGRSGASMIIHDTDDEDQEEPDAEEPEPVTTDPQSEPAPAPTLAPRTRKAKELQTRLGVGRPVAAGGSGARAITKSTSISKGKRGKSKSMKVVEATIPEEEPEEPPTLPMPIDPPDPGSTGITHDAGPSQESIQSNVSSLLALGDIDRHVANALCPLHEEMQSLKSQLEQMQTLKAEVTQLTTRLADVEDLKRKVQTLTVELADLRTQNTTIISALNAEMRQLKETVSTSLKATESPKARNPLIDRLKSPVTKKASASGPYVLASDASSSNSSSQTVNVATTSNPDLPHPGIAPTTLGKRHRDSMASDITGVIEEGQEDEFSQEELAKRVVRHTKKRARLSPGSVDQISDTVGEALAASNDEPQSSMMEEEEEEFESAPAPRVPSFTVFSGPEEPPEDYLDPPPPTTHLPEFFGPPSSLDTSRPARSTANASENHNPFTFSFVPTTSTPANPLYNMPSFPYPEAPQSPSPAGPSIAAGFSRQPGERRPHHDLFQSFIGPRRPESAAASGSSLQDAPGAFINPAALTRPSRPPEVSSNEFAAGLGLGAVKESGAEQAASTAKKTMYGTELDGDTRFGDFGVEGVATGFWSGKGY